MNFLWRWGILSIAVLVATQLKFLGIHCEGAGSLLTVALLLGIVNTFVRPILMLVTLPAIVLSFGLAILVLNALLFWGISRLVDGFTVPGFWSALGGSLVISLVSLIFGGAARRRVQVPPQNPPPPRPPPRTPPPGNGPIIDV